MKHEKGSYTIIEEDIVESKENNLGDVVRKYLYHWPLFVAVLILSLAAALAYLNIAPPGYTVKARVLIKDDEKGNGQEPALQELNLFKVRTLVENELEVLKSRNLMSNVVKQLQLSANYILKDKLTSTDLYTESPVKLALLAPSKITKPHSVEIIIKDEHSFILKQKGSETNVAFSSRLRSPFGLWKLSPLPGISAWAGKAIEIIVSDPNEVIDSYVDKLNAELTNKSTTVVELSMKENVPQRGKDILNTLIAEYNHATIDDKNRIRQSTLDFIDRRLSSLTGELTSLEMNVENFKSSRGLTDISSESKFFLENVKNNDARMNEVNVQLEVVTGIERYVNSEHSSGNAPATAGITDPGLVTLINQLITLEMKKDQLLGSSPEGSPILEPVNRQISSVKHSIRENIRGIKSSLQASRNQLRVFNSGFEASIKKLPGQEREYITIKRQQSIKEELYVYLLQKREEAAVSYATSVADSRTIDQAYAGKPDSPNKMICLGAALISALLIPVGLISGRRLLNNRVLDVKEVQKATLAPVLGELVYQRSKTHIVLQDKDRRMIAEQFRSLRANLQYIYTHKEIGRITLLTSGMAGEGKSFITCNLGAALAAAGRKTLILELDLRNPMVSKYLKTTVPAGLSDYLKGETTTEQMISPVAGYKNLYVAAAGKVPENPSELITSPYMDQLINELRDQYDEILIDTPPVQLVADAMILAQYSDVNLYVVRHGFTYRSQLDFVKQLYAEQKLKRFNIIFNGAEMTRTGGAYQYYYDHKSEPLKSGIRDFFKRF